MGGLCAGSVKESEIDLEKAKKEAEMRENAVNPRNIDDLEADFLAMLGEIEFPNPAVKVRIADLLDIATSGFVASV